MKKNLFLMTIAVLATLATSCSKDNDATSDVQEQVLSIRVASGIVKNRSVDNPAASTTGTLKLTNGLIFILDGNIVVDKEPIAVGAGENGIQSADGQKFPRKVKKGATVYIVSNIPTDKVTSWSPRTLTEINSEVLDIANPFGQDYAQATMANSDAIAEGITSTTRPL